MARQRRRCTIACWLVCALLAVLGAAPAERTRPVPAATDTAAPGPCPTPDSHHAPTMRPSCKPPTMSAESVLRAVLDGLAEAPPAASWNAPGADLAAHSIPAGHIDPQPA